MSLINPVSIAAASTAASMGIAKLAQVAQPIADFAVDAVRGVRGPQDVSEGGEAGAAGKSLSPREQLIHDARSALFDLVQMLEGKFSEAGVTVDDPLELQISHSGRIIVANAHPARDAVEEVLAERDIQRLFHETAARFHELETHPQQHRHPAAPQRFQLRFGTGELLARFV